MGPDTALMVELVSTTVQQLNELEELVTSAEKYTQKLREYNELMEDKYFQAERVLYLAEDLAAKRNIEDLDDLNSAIRNLKYTMGDFRDTLDEYRQVEKGSEKEVRKVEFEERVSKLRENQAKKQVQKSIDAGTSSRANQLSAQNTALMLESQEKSLSVQQRMLKEMAKQNVMGANKLTEDKLKEEQKYRAYGLLGGEE